MAAPRSKAELLAAGYTQGNLANCRGCGFCVEWWKTPAGKMMPMQIAEGTNGLLIPHWATCPKGKEFRKRTWNPPPKRF